MSTALGPAILGILGIAPGALQRDLDRSGAVLTAQPSPQHRPWRSLGEHKGDQVTVCEVAAVPRSGLLHGAGGTDRGRAAARWQPALSARRAAIRR